MEPWAASGERGACISCQLAPGLHALDVLAEMWHGCATPDCETGIFSDYKIFSVECSCLPAQVGGLAWLLLALRQQTHVQLAALQAWEHTMDMQQQQQRQLQTHGLASFSK
jgi:hypothetical protein